MYYFVCSEDFWHWAIFNWFSMNWIAIVVIEDEELCVTHAGWNGESSHLVCEDFSCGWIFCGCCVAVVSSFIVGIGCWPEIIICLLLIVGVIAAYVWFCFLFEGDFGFGGSLILATLIQVPFYHSYQLWWVFLKCFFWETWELYDKVFPESLL